MQLRLPKNPLIRGMIVKAVVTSCGIFTGMPAVDPDHFNFLSFAGIARMFGAIAWLVFIAECRYIEDWLKNFKNGEDSNAPKA